MRAASFAALADKLVPAEDATKLVAELDKSREGKGTFAGTSRNLSTSVTTFVASSAGTSLSTWGAHEYDSHPL